MHLYRCKADENDVNQNMHHPTEITILRSSEIDWRGALAKILILKFPNRLK